VLQAGGVASLAPAALVFLRGRDADARLRELAAARACARPVLGALAGALVARRSHEALGYRSLGDYGRERLGVGARCLREWARVWRRLAALPVLREALLSGQIGWQVARRVVAVVAPETQAACLEAVRGRTLRAVEAIVAAVREAEARAAAAPAFEEGAARAEGDRVPVRLRCTRREAELWAIACELARRVAGEELAVWECADRVAAEAASALGAEPEEEWEGAASACAAQPGPGHAPPARDADTTEHGLRECAFPGLGWTPVRSGLPARLAALAEGLEDAAPRELDRRLRAAIAFLQTLDLEVGRILRQMQDRRLFAELGFTNLARYAEERLDVSARTARRLVALARAEHRAPAVAIAFRAGCIHAFQARTLARVAHLGSARAWVERAREVTLRRLEAEAEAAALAAPRPAVIAFRAPPDVAAFFLSMLARAGSLERLLAHAIATWVEQGSVFEDYADFTRDGFRCTVPGCTARSNLQSHHIRFRSAGGPDEAWNRTTLCAFHHQRGVHGGGGLRIRGRAPDGLVYALGPEPCERFRSGDVRAFSPDRLP
jgi:hypothetical protein